jgi:hypothetical protein
LPEPGRRAEQYALREEKARRWPARKQKFFVKSHSFLDNALRKGLSLHTG